LAQEAKAARAMIYKFATHHPGGDCPQSPRSATRFRIPSGIAWIEIIQQVSGNAKSG
jgi:hypothetical protein